MNSLSRRRLITTGLAAAAGAAGLGVAARLAQAYGLVPPDHRGIYGLGETLTYASQRLLTRHSLAREFSRSQISKPPLANEMAPPNAAFKRLQAGGFADWRLAINGMVERPASFSLAQLQSYPTRSQITQLACEEGWSYIAEWIGVPLSHVLGVVGVHPQGLLAKHRLARSDRGEDVLQVADIRSGDEHRIDFGTAAELCSGSKGERNPISRGGHTSLIRVPPGKRNHFAIMSQGKTRHQPPHGVESKACDTETNHESSPQSHAAGSCYFTYLWPISDPPLQTSIFAVL